MEQIDIEFDPAWLADAGDWQRVDRLRCWTNGAVALRAHKLARILTSKLISEAEAAQATARFLTFAIASCEGPAPAWLSQVEMALGEEEPPSTTDLARQLKLNPAWLAHAYRAFVGEGIHETILRKRVERAAVLLRRSRLTAAEIAAIAGFCDQSHMNRCFQRLLGRTPIAVRAEMTAC